MQSLGRRIRMPSPSVAPVPDGAAMWAKRPREFWIAAGETREIVLLDAGEPCETVVHKLPGRTSAKGNVVHDRYETCAGWVPDPQGRPCQLCQKGERANHVWVMSCVDCTPYVTRDGEVVDWTRKIVLVPEGEHVRWIDLMEAAGGSFRGARVALVKTDRRPLGAASLVGVLPEAEMVRLFGQSGCRSYRYADFVAPPSVDDLAQRHGGGGPNPGSKAAAMAAFGADWE